MSGDNATLSHDGTVEAMRTAQPRESELHEVRAAPVLLIAGESEEQIAIGVTAVDAHRVVRTWPTIVPKSLSSMLGPDRGIYVEAAKYVLRDLERIRTEAELDNWKSPLLGFRLGLKRSFYVEDLEDLIETTSTSLSLLYRATGRTEDSLAQSVTREATVAQIVRLLRPNLENYLDRPAFLGNTVFETRFTFLSPYFAANYVRLEPRSLLRTVTRAKAGLWDLSLLPSAHSQLFKPERRELLAGVDDAALQDPGTADAMRELQHEAELRDVPVVRVQSSREAADRIISIAA